MQRIFAVIIILATAKPLYATHFVIVTLFLID